MNTLNADVNSYENFETIKQMMARFDIEINDIKKSHGYQYNLKTSHKRAVLLAGSHFDVLNFDFLTFKNGKIETKYPVNKIIQKVIDFGNQQVDFFDALRLFDIELNKMYSYNDSVKAFIDFELDWENPHKHEIVLNFSHTKSQMCQLVSNKSTIASSYNSMHIVFDLDGNMTVNRVNVNRKRTLEAWDNVIEKDFKEYGILTEMVRI